MVIDYIKKHLCISLLIAVAAFVLFVFRSSYQTPDSINYAYKIAHHTTIKGMFHPHHILFIPVCKAIYNALHIVSHNVDGIFAAQVHNILFALIALAAFYFILRELEIPPLIACFATFLLFSCSGFLMYSTQAEVFIPALSCLVLLVLTSLKIKRKKNSVRLCITAAFILAISIGYHQTNVLFCIPLFILLFDGSNIKQSLRNYVIIIGLAGIMVVLAYLLIAFAAHNNTLSADNVSSYMFKYLHSSSNTWGSFDNFSTNGLKKMLNSLAANFVHLPSHGKLVGFIIGITTIGFAVLLSSLSLLKCLKWFFVFLFSWIIVYQVFFLWWIPWMDKFFLLPVVPLVLLLALYVDFLVKQKAIKISLISVLAITLFCINFYSLVLPNHQSKGPVYDKAKQMACLTPRDCIVCTSYEYKEILRYYFGKWKYREIPIIMTYFYKNTSLPARYTLRNEEPLFVPIEYIMPGYTFRGANGYKYPDGWLDYIEYVFGASTTPKGRYRFNTYDVVSDTEGHLYIIIRPEPQVTANFEDFARLFDSSVSNTLKIETEIYEKWLEITRNDWLLIGDFEHGFGKKAFRIYAGSGKVAFRQANENTFMVTEPGKGVSDFGIAFDINKPIHAKAQPVLTMDIGSNHPFRLYVGVLLQNGRSIYLEYCNSKHKKDTGKEYFFFLDDRYLQGNLESLSIDINRCIKQKGIQSNAKAVQSLKLRGPVMIDNILLK